MYKRQPPDQAVIDRCVEKMIACGALDECSEESNAMVADAWDQLNRVMPESFYKVMLRTIGRYVTQDPSSTVVSARC